jgi:hypothetical protein
MTSRQGTLLDHRRTRAVVGAAAGVIALAAAGFVTLRVCAGAPGDFGGGPSRAELVPGGPSATATADGLVYSLQISPGPYFLSELVAAEMTLTNGSQTAYDLRGAPQETICDPALWPEVDGGQAPTYTLPTSGRISCPDSGRTLSPRGDVDHR